MNFLITGITGFVGPHLANLLLDNGHDVYGLIRGSNGREADLLDVLKSQQLKKIKFLYGDLTNYHSIEKIFINNKFDGVFHLAAQSHPPTSFINPVLTFDTNVTGSINLITSMERHQRTCRLHFCSTSEVYGNANTRCRILNEETSLSPINPYAVSKAAIDLYVQERINNSFIDGFITRAFSHTGPRRGYNFSISSDAYQIAKMMKGLQKRILLVGNLKSRRAVMDVRDCVKAYYSLMMSKKKEIYNVAGSDVREMNYFTDLLIELSGLKDVEKKIHQPFYRPIDIQAQIGDSTKVKQAVGWKTTMVIEDTLNDLLDYWLKKI